MTVVLPPIQVVSTALERIRNAQNEIESVALTAGLEGPALAQATTAVSAMGVAFTRATKLLAYLRLAEADRVQVAAIADKARVQAELNALP